MSHFGYKRQLRNTISRRQAHFLILSRSLASHWSRVISLSAFWEHEMENIGGLNGIEVRAKLDEINLGFEHFGVRLLFLGWIFNTNNREIRKFR